MRLLELDNIVPYSDQEKLRRDAEYYHKWGLDELFEEFRNYSAYGLYQLPPLRLIKLWCICVSCPHQSVHWIGTLWDSIPSFCTISASPTPKLTQTWGLLREKTFISYILRRPPNLLMTVRKTGSNVVYLPVCGLGIPFIDWMRQLGICNRILQGVQET